VRFFFDNCVNRKYVEALRILAAVQRYDLVHLTDIYPPNMPDVEWMSALAEQGDWVVISADPRITRNKAERRAWQESGLTTFFFSDNWSQKQFWKQVGDLITWWPEITLAARSAAAGTGYLVPVRGKELRQIYP
jgi:hypothetical protein